METTGMNVKYEWGYTGKVKKPKPASVLSSPATRAELFIKAV